MKVLKLILIFVILVLFTNICSSSSLIVKAENPFKTNTVNRFDEIVETQDAYEPLLKVKKIEKGSEYTYLNDPSDMFIDKDDYIYIADTSNKRIIILNSSYEYVSEYQSDEFLKPMGLYVRNDYIYVADYGIETSSDSGAIYKLFFNKETKSVTFDKKYSSPISKILEIDSFQYHPKKIAVDMNETMYVVNEGSYNGIMTISSENRFMSYFAPNKVTSTLEEKIIRFLYGENNNVFISDNLPTEPYNVNIDDSGYIYTVTQTTLVNNIGDTLKKVNLGGLNFYPDDMESAENFVDCTSGSVGNVYALTKAGFIYEYDIEGNILFIFGGTSTSIDQLGLFKGASSISTDSNGCLYILDQNDDSFQVFTPTDYANLIHTALGLYNDGKYEESKWYFERVLESNGLLDIAHKGIGMAYYLEGKYEEALKELEIANAKKEYSEAYWEIRNVELSNNMPLIFALVILFIILLIVIPILNKKTKIFDGLKNLIRKLKSIKRIKDLLTIFKSMRHPIDSTYYIKTDKSIGITNGLIVFVILIVVYIFGLTCTSFLYSTVVLERTVLLKEVIKIVIPIALFVVANYLSSSLLEGEGTFRSVFITTLAALTPVIVIYPIAIIISNVLTYSESVIYYLLITLMALWSGCLLIVMNKELHNYTFKEMILNIIMTILLMAVLLIVVILCYLMVNQVIVFIKDIVREVIFNE